MPGPRGLEPTRRHQFASLKAVSASPVRTTPVGETATTFTPTPGFAKPALIAWSADDAFFGLEDGRRLAAVLMTQRAMESSRPPEFFVRFWDAVYRGL